MKPRSKKDKGVRLQNEVKEKLREHYKHRLEEDDIQSAIMGQSGVDIILSPAAKKEIPFDIECKNTQKLQLWQAIKQAEENANKGRIPLVVFRRNHSKTYAIIEFETLLNLLGVEPNDEIEG